MATRIDMKKFNTIDFVDSLAEITRHYDRDVIERSLLKTLCEVAAQDSDTRTEFRIYRVLNNCENPALALMSYVKNNVIDTLDHEIKNPVLPEVLFNAILCVIETQRIQIIDPQDTDEKYVIYPAIDKNGEVFALLIHTCEHLEYDNQRLIHALLKVYSNYLELIDKASRDKLTQLLNRETLHAEITRILIRNGMPRNNVLKFKSYPSGDARQSDDNSVYWLAVLDIDFFKNINDSYGHLYGDEILILVARLIDKNIRNSDFAFRYGGEEFVIILLAKDIECAKMAFERIRMVINKHSYAKVDNLSVSVGVTCINHQGDPVAVIEEADQALYYAKKHGRNQTQFYAELLQQNLIAQHQDATPSGNVDFF